jgi:hypothetical protein
MAGIEVQVTDDGPALFEVVLADRSGEDIGCSPAELSEYAEELRERAFGLVHRREVRPLPAGAIRVRVWPDESGLHPDVEQVARQLAERILH